MTLNRREAEKGSGDWSPGGFGIVAMRPLCGIQHGGNRKERLRVREAGASAAGRGQRPYASFPDRQPYRTPTLPNRAQSCINRPSGFASLPDFISESLRDRGAMGEFIPQAPCPGTRPRTPSSLRAYGSFL